MTHTRALDAARRPRRDVSGDPAVTGSRRTAVELAYFDGLTEEQIAHALDVPQASVAERIRDEMRRLTARRPPPGPTPPSPAGE
jgi:predicted RNA polymerase sigma factor